MKAIGAEQFQSDGRGPVLQRVMWSAAGALLRAIEYGDSETGETRHVRIIRCQVVQITPEEVINYQLDGVWRLRSPVAAADLGQTPFLRSFSPRHLGRCSHFQLMFYDELFDIIAEGLEWGRGSFPSDDAIQSAR